MISTPQRSWAESARAVTEIPSRGLLKSDLVIDTSAPLQRVEGFGAAFSELGWIALSQVPPATRASILDELFVTGAKLSYCRLPIGANDYSRDWYSYDETPADFHMDHFSLERDHEALIPFIKAALGRRPDLRLWASPWSPPTWMKYNRHYAMSSGVAFGLPDNGMRADQVGAPGKDMFIQDDAYFAAYALYFRKFIEGYRQVGIKVDCVMPQNEFDIPSPWPACCWTAQGLARFVPFLGRELDPLGVRIFLGTVNNSDPRVVDRVLEDPEAARYIKGVGLQWAGRAAIPAVHYAHPNLVLMQSEQECGDGRNDWRFAKYAWSMMKNALRAGVSIYDYWNMVTLKGGRSSWGWSQNALVVVDPARATASLTPDYFVLKHVSYFVRSGAHLLSTLTLDGYDEALAFLNPDGTLSLTLHNPEPTIARLRILVGSRLLVAELPPESFNSILLPAGQLLDSQAPD
jgi:glucosylceramidase